MGFEVIASFVQGHCMEAHARFLAQPVSTNPHPSTRLLLARIVGIPSPRPYPEPHDGSEAVDHRNPPVLQRATWNKPEVALPPQQDGRG